MAHADFSRFVKDDVDVFERSIDNSPVANVTLHEFDVLIQIRRARAIAVYLRHQSVKHVYVMPALDQRIHEVRADKTGPTSNQNISCFQLDSSLLLQPQASREIGGRQQT